MQGCRGRMAMVWVGSVPHPGAGMRMWAGAGSAVPFQLKAALLGVDARNLSDAVHSWEAAGCSWKSWALGLISAQSSCAASPL